MKVKHLLLVVSYFVKLIERAGAKAYSKANAISSQITDLRAKQNLLDNEALHASRVAGKLKEIIS